MEPFIVAFIGNRVVSDCEDVLNKLLAELEDLFGNRGMEPLGRYPVFYCGGYGQFSGIASDAIDLLRKHNPDMKSEKLFITPYASPSYLRKNAFMREYYDDIVYPPLENVPARFAICRRNQWMIDRCDLLFAYMENPVGNTRKCVEYAFRKEKDVYFVDSGEAEKLLRFRRRNEEEKPHI